MSMPPPYGQGPYPPPGPGYGPAPGGPPPAGPPGPKKKGGDTGAILAVVGCLLFCCVLPVVLLIALPVGTGVFALFLGGTTVNAPSVPPSERAAPRGTPVTVGGFRVVVARADLAADALLVREDPALRPAPGRRLVAVDVSLANEGTVAMPAASVDLALLAGTGETTPPVASPVGRPASLSAPVAPWGTATGRLVFEVGEADAPSVVLQASAVGGERGTLALR